MPTHLPAKSARALLVLCVGALSVLVSCGGGGGSSGGGVTPPIGVPTTVPIASPASATQTVPIGNASAQVTFGPLSSGAAGSLSFAPAQSGSANATVTEASTIPSGAPTPMSALSKATRVRILSLGGSVTALLYISVSVPSAVTIAQSPAFSLTFPAGTLAGDVYVVDYNPANASAGWNVVTGPQPGTGSTISFPSVALVPSLALSPNGLVIFAVVETGTPLPTPTPSSAPSPAPSPTVLLPSVLWTSIGPSEIPQPQTSLPGSGKIMAFAMSAANSSNIFVGGGMGSGSEGPLNEAGVFESSSAGVSWQAIDNGLTDTIVDNLWVDPTNANDLVAGTWLTGIFASTNGGSSWTLTGPYGESTGFTYLNGVLYAATSQGIVASTDSGQTWTMFEATASPVYALAAVGTTFLAGELNGTAILSTNAGASWSTTYTGSPTAPVWAVAIDPANTQDFFVIAQGSPFLTVSTNGGTTWANLSLPSNRQPQALDFSAAVQHLLYVGVGGGLYTTQDNGASFSLIPNEPFDTRSVFTISGQPNTIIVGSDQGAYETTNDGSSWSSLTGSLSTSILTGMSINGNMIMTAVQDYSPITSFDGGSTWTQLSGSHPDQGEDGDVLINPANSTYCYSYTTSGYQYSGDGCNTFSFGGISSPNNNLPHGNSDMITVDAQNPSTVYVAAQSAVYKSTSWGANMTATGWPIANSTAIAVDPTNGNNIYVGAGNNNSGSLYITHDGGTTWSTTPLTATGYPITIAIDPANPQLILVGMSSIAGFGGGVLRSTDGGSTFISANSGTSMNTISAVLNADWCIRFNSTGSMVALATSTGIYLSMNQGTSWNSIDANAISNFFTAVAWSNNYLYASTFGQGVLRSQSPL